MQDEALVMEQLRRLVRAAAIADTLARTSAELRQELADSTDAKSTHASVPLELYGPELPPGIRSSWIFVLRAEHDHPAERHPNSIQRMFALDSAGAMEVWNGDDWEGRPLEPALDDPGLSIPAYCWHRPARLEQAWSVVSFHSVAPEELIEEVGDPATNRTQASRHYLADG